MSAINTLNKLIDTSDGKIVTVVFTKKDGTERVLNGRLGVKAPLKGGVRTTDPKQYFIMYDMQKAGYRAVNRDTIKEVRLGGIVAKAA